MFSSIIFSVLLARSKNHGTLARSPLRDIWRGRKDAQAFAEEVRAKLLCKRECMPLSHPKVVKLKCFVLFYCFLALNSNDAVPILAVAWQLRRYVRLDGSVPKPLRQAKNSRTGANSPLLLRDVAGFDRKVPRPRWRWGGYCCVAPLEFVDQRRELQEAESSKQLLWSWALWSLNPEGS